MPTSRRYPILPDLSPRTSQSCCCVNIGVEIGWYDPLPSDQGEHWITFLASLLSLNDVHFERRLWPLGEVIGLPTLIIFSDGAAFLHSGQQRIYVWSLLLEDISVGYVKMSSCSEEHHLHSVYGTKRRCHR